MHVAAALLSVTLLAGCGGKTGTTVAEEGAGAPKPAVAPTSTAGAPKPAVAPTSTEGEYTGACPTEGNAKPFAKTRFALHAGLALGAFHRYIYRPLRSGGFQARAEKRKRTFVKAAVAGAFALHEMRVAKGFAAANPRLCKAVEGVTGHFSNLADRLKSGTATPADLDASKSSMDALQGDATKTGFPFKEQNVTIPGAA
ncbi:hypothetical protein ACQEU2_21745 [Microtetraspora malaysiensis]